MFRKIIKILLVLFLCLAFATAFMESSELADGTFTAKTFYFYLVSVLIITLSIIYLIISKKEIKLSINRIDAALLIFYFYSIVRLIFTTQVPLYNARIICFTFLIILYFLFKYIFLKNIFDKPNYPAYIILFAFLTAGLLQGLIGLFQTYEIFGYSRGQFIAVGSFGNPAPYAGFIESVLPFSFGISLLLNGNNFIDRLLKKYSLLTFLICLLVLPSTETRGAWVASITGIIFILFIKYKLIVKIKSFFDRRWRIVSASVGLLALTILLFTSLYHIRPASAFGRLLIWKVSENMILEHPIFGIGYDSFGNNYNNYQASYFAQQERDEGVGVSKTMAFEKYVASNVSQAHNEYIETTAELGIVGLVLLLFIFYNVFKKNNLIEPNSNALADASRASIITLMLSAFFSYPFQILPTFLNFIFMLSMTSSWISTVSSSISPNKLYFRFSYNFSKSIRYFIPLTLMVFFILSLFVYREIRNYKAHLDWAEAKSLSYFQIYPEALKIYENLYYDLQHHGNFLQNYGGTLSLAGKHLKAIQILEECKKINAESNLYLSLGNSYEALGNFKNAKEAYLKASFIVPGQFYPKYLLAKLYQKLGEYDKAKAIAMNLITSKPKIPSSAIEEMKIEMKKLIEEPRTSYRTGRLIGN